MLLLIRVKIDRPIDYSRQQRRRRRVKIMASFEPADATSDAGDSAMSPSSAVVGDDSSIDEDVALSQGPSKVGPCEFDYELVRRACLDDVLLRSEIEEQARHSLCTHACARAFLSTASTTLSDETARVYTCVFDYRRNCLHRW